MTRYVTKVLLLPNQIGIATQTAFVVVE
jgi:hypothetical protein